MLLLFMMCRRQPHRLDSRVLGVLLGYCLNANAQIGMNIPVLVSERQLDILHQASVHGLMLDVMHPEAPVLATTSLCML